VSQKVTEMRTAPKTSIPKSARELKSFAAHEHRILLLQGGGALGAYQVGVYEAMHDAGVEPDWVIGTSIGITVADMATSFEFYRDLLGLEIQEPRRASNAELRLSGLADGELTQAVAMIPGTGAFVRFSVFRLPATAPVARPFRWRIQDVGAPQFQLQVMELDALLERTKQAGYRFLSVGAKPIQRPFGRFVFAIDPDGVLVEFVEPAARQ